MRSLLQYLKIGTAGFFLLIMIVIMTTTAEGRTITVDDDGEADHQTIQEAVDAANPSDTISVSAGTYEEYVVVDKDVTIHGESRLNTFIHGNGNDHVVRLQTDGITLETFTITSSSQSKDGIFIQANHCTVKNVNITGPLYGIEISTGVTIVYKHTAIRDCIIDTANYGLYLRGGPHSITGTSLVDCGFRLSGCDDVSFSDCSSIGGSINIAQGTNITFEDCDLQSYYKLTMAATYSMTVCFMDCLLDDGFSGIEADSETLVILKNSVIQYNSGVGVKLCRADIQDCIFRENYNAVTIQEPITLKNNHFTNDGLYLTTECDHESGNLVNDKPFLLVHDESDLIFDQEYGQIILIGCDGITLRDQKIGDLTYGIIMVDCTNCTVMDSEIMNVRVKGIYQMGGGENSLINCTLTQDQQYRKSCGISLTGTEKTLISECNVELFDYGIHIGGSSSYCELRDSTIRNIKVWGIELDNSANTTITRSHICYNPTGILVRDSSRDETIVSNNIYSNSNRGMSVYTDHDGNVSARNNWWGDASGPFHDPDNEDGKGNEVTGPVDFGAWKQLPFDYFLPIPMILDVTPDPAIEKDPVSFFGWGTVWGSIVRYSWRSSLDNSIYNGTQNSFSLSNLSYGSHTIFLKVQDDFGFWGPEISMLLTVIENNTPPLVSIQTPANDSLVKGVIRISGGASDADGEVEYVQISIDGGSWINVTGTGDWSYQWHSTESNDGDIVIRSRCYDGKNYSAVFSIVVLVDNQASEKEEDGGFIPGPGFTAMICGLFIALFVRSRRKLIEK